MKPQETNALLAHGEIPFQTEGRLLEELGLRLVARPEVALVELIKNSYDADSPTCTVRLEDNNKSLIVADQGHGMTFAAFQTRWMRIATSVKAKEGVSPIYGRRLTGAKGIGRFAVRYLGDHLTLESVAFDQSHDCLTKLTAIFDWPRLDAFPDIAKASVKYELVRAQGDASAGTTLTIRQLRDVSDFVSSQELRDNVLKMVSPIQGLESGKFANVKKDKGADPGFKVILPAEGEDQDTDLAKFVLDNHWARLTIQLEKGHLKFSVWFSSSKKPKNLDVKITSNISEGLFADIRFFPHRKGVFHAKGVDGRKAWNWVRENYGVAVVDHGFRIKPYGFPNDDWLMLDSHTARNERDWQTKIARRFFPISPAIKSDPALNPMLNLPHNLQLVGAVFILSRPSLRLDEAENLVPAMDREGLLDNKAFEELKEYVRAGIEFLAKEDKEELDRLAEEEAKEAARAARQDIKSAIEHVQESPTLKPADKSRIIKQYQIFAERLEDVEEYSAQARRSLTTMSLLGVIAGFMTHESKAIAHELDGAVTHIRALGRKDPEIAKIADDLSRRLESFKGYLEYSRMFIKNVREPREQALSAAGQVRQVVNRFKSFTEDRGIKISNEIASDVMTPPLPVTLYSGVLLNLFTNAIKGVIAAKGSVTKPHVCFRAWNEKKAHIVEIADNGIGIPPEMRKRIWDPLYTTTSDVGNPLGSGMGLGLTLVKQVVGELGGSIALMPNPPAGFTTSFRVTLHRK